MSNKNLKVCKTCGNQVAKSAKKCPHCGAKLRWGFFEKVIGCVVVGWVSLMIIGMTHQSDHHNTATTAEKSAYEVVKREIISRLKDPDSFKELENGVVNENGNKMVIIKYTATNGFGARIKGGAIGIVDAQNKLLTFKAGNL